MQQVYHIVLFAHICALLAAIAASALVHFAEFRIRSARAVGDAQQWNGLASRVEKVFPVALLTLVASGAYMVSTLWSWTEGWIDMALVGVALLFVTGAYLGSRGKALARALGDDPHAPISAAAARMIQNPVRNAISTMNTSLAVGIVFLMVNKSSLGASIITLLIFLAIGALVSVPLWRGARVATPARAGERAG